MRSLTLSQHQRFYWGMRIGELAGLVGITTRAVRHHHRIGLLPEPADRPTGTASTRYGTPSSWPGSDACPSWD
jgi:hypothetical protein